MIEFWPVAENRMFLRSRVMSLDTAIGAYALVKRNFVCVWDFKLDFELDTTWFDPWTVQ